MSIITTDELVRGLMIGVFGGAAGACTLAFPGSALWVLPAGVAVFGCAATVPEIRQELSAVLPPETRRLLAAPAQSLGQWVRTGQLPARAALAPPQAPRKPQAAPAPQAAAAGPLRPAEWLRTLNGEPDRAPHSLIIGPSGAGKTTLAAAVLGKRGGATVVLSPKVNAGNWRGAETITLDDEGSYAPLAAALGALEREKRRRIVALRRGEALKPLTVVLDETPELVANVPDTGPFVVSMASIGRELGMRLVLLSTSERVGALGIKGRGDTLANFVRVDLDRDRRATLNDGVREYPIELGNVTQGAERAQLRPWRRPAPAAAPQVIVTPAPAQASQVAAPEVAGEARNLLAELLGAAVPEASGRDRDSEVSLRPYVPKDEQGHRDSARSEVVVMPRDGGELHVHVHASAEAHTPAAARHAEPWQRKGPRLNARARRQRGTQGPGRADELHQAYTAAGAAGRRYRAVYRELGGSKDTTLAAWQRGRAQRQK